LGFFTPIGEIDARLRVMLPMWQLPTRSIVADQPGLAWDIARVSSEKMDRAIFVRAMAIAAVALVVATTCVGGVGSLIQHGRMDSDGQWESALCPRIKHKSGASLFSTPCQKIGMHLTAT
jgi:hypothetical protein